MLNEAYWMVEFSGLDDHAPDVPNVSAPWPHFARAYKQWQMPELAMSCLGAAMGRFCCRTVGAYWAWLHCGTVHSCST
jgi:hypothetical protein